MASTGRRIVLQFAPPLDVLASGKRLSQGISAGTAVADSLWLAHDETVSIERLGAERTKSGSVRYARHQRFDLRSFVALSVPGDRSSKQVVPEADLEGIAFADDYLWVIGSHSAVRDKPDALRTGDAISALAHVRRSGNRFLLARVPMKGGLDGPTLVRRCQGEGGRVLNAGRLAGGRKNDALTRALSGDPHLGPFLDLPSKDNGLDIEGLAAAADGRLFLGLRGPVLNGWACILEIRIGTHPERVHELVLQKMPRASSASASARYRKHFLDLGGMGIRDLCLAGRDLLILTGPPMRGKGGAEVRRWKGALAIKGDSLHAGRKLPKLLELPYRAKKDHAEGIAIVGRRNDRVSLIVFYDSVDSDRRLAAGGMWATVHILTLPNAHRMMHG